MNDPNKPNEEPRRVSNPNPQTPPIEEPPMPGTEYEKNVPHQPEPSTAVSKSGEAGEGSYQGTRQYLEGYEKFAEKTSPENALKKAKEIDSADPSLKQAEKSGRIAQNGGTGGRISAPSIH